jgi:hypothetical protein
VGLKLSDKLKKAHLLLATKWPVLHWPGGEITPETLGEFNRSFPNILATLL